MSIFQIVASTWAHLPFRSAVEHRCISRRRFARQWWTIRARRQGYLRPQNWRKRLLTPDRGRLRSPERGSPVGGAAVGDEEARDEGNREHEREGEEFAAEASGARRFHPTNVAPLPACLWGGAA